MWIKPSLSKNSKKRKQSLQHYRQKQARLALYRDNDQCAVCWFVDKKTTVCQDIHHVYGRGRRAGDWRENYRSLLCVCRVHHSLPIQFPGGEHPLVWMEDILREANATPINRRFQHVDEKEEE